MIRQLSRILDESKRIVFFGGAGVSTESGIPDFRSEQGLYRARESFGHSPEVLLSRSFFMEHPEIFYRYHRGNILHLGAKPNAAHRALALLEQAGRLKAVITQNIDGLHQLAGSKRVLELHGSAQRNYCMDCGESHSLKYTLSRESWDEDEVPRCALCGGVIRPDVVLYEESLDQQILAQAVEAVASADTLLVGGTSLVVYPAAGLLRDFSGANLVLINRDETPYDSQAQLVIHDSIGRVLGQCVPGAEEEP